MIFDAHLGSRVGALVDGQLSPADEERAWVHVHGCTLCREAVEREGWVKRQLASLALAPTPAPTLKGHLSRTTAPAPPELSVWPAHEHRSRRYVGLAALGAGSVGAAMFTMVALAAAPAQAPAQDRRLPVASLTRSVDGPGTSTPALDRRLPSTIRTRSSRWP